MIGPPTTPTLQAAAAEAWRWPIETPSLQLRPFAPADAQKVFRMSQEEDMRIWLPSQVYRDPAHAASVVDHLIAQVRHPADPRVGPFVLGVRRKGTDELVGHVGLSPYDGGVEIGFAIERAHQRRGFATEAVRAACRLAVDAFSLPTILGITAAGNAASRAVLLQAGFLRQNEAVLRFQGSDQAVVILAFSAAH